MAINITPVTNHRGRENGLIIYPVYSRRSEGLSIGINLFPDKKSCAFGCPYCEIFPFSPNSGFSVSRMEDDLRGVITGALEKDGQIKDICFSGNGEPTLSPSFKEALKSTETIRSRLAPLARIVIITNGTGLLQPDVFSLLTESAADINTDIWLKLDAGTSEWYQKINRSLIPFNKLIEKIKTFASRAPFTIQTMLCAVNGETAPPEDVSGWEALVCELAANNVRKVQLYGKARAAPEDPLTSELPEKYLEDRAQSLRARFTGKGITTPVEIYI